MAVRKNPFAPLLEKIPAPFRNRYFFCLFLFIGWLTFFDRHNFKTQIQLQQQLNKLHADKGYYEKEIEKVKADKKNLKRHTEKFAREQYYMKKKNEDVFIIVKNEEH